MVSDTLESQYNLEEWDWRKLVRNIGRGKCILLLGPEAASDPSGDHHEPLSVLLAHRLAAKLEGALPHHDPGDLAQVAQLYLAQKDKERTDLEMAVEDFYSLYKNRTTALHRSLATLPFRLCITTTPDDFLANAFRSADKNPQPAFYHFRSGQVPHLSPPGEATPLIYKLFGDIAGDDSGSLVLTETDLLDFLVNVISNQPALPSELLKQFADPETSFLFLGFGFHQWYLRILLHVLRKERPKSRSLALEDKRFFLDPLHPQIAWYFDQSQAIEFKQCSWTAFADQLQRRFESAASAGSQAAIEPPLDAPTIFLCHCAEDQEQVDALGQRLRAMGLNTWRDRDNLRGGDNWDRVLEHVLKNQVDYVLVLQTPAMLSRAESYFFKEINMALSRQQYVGTEFKFIFPAFLADCANRKLKELDHLQFTDLQGEEGFKRLVADIRADQEKRRSLESAA